MKNIKLIVAILVLVNVVVITWLLVRRPAGELEGGLEGGVELALADNTMQQARYDLSDRAGELNILLISMDALRWDRTGLSGQATGLTPNIDAFAEEAVVFHSTVASASWTLPSHMSVWTARWPSVHGVTNKLKLLSQDQMVPTSLSPGIETFPDYLIRQGYTAAGFSGGAGVQASYGFGRDFETYQDDRPFAGLDYGVEPALEWLAAHRGERWFMFLHGYDSHGQYPLSESKLEALRADYQMRLALSESSRLFNRAHKLQLEQEEAEQLAIDVAAARNDPNIRIYRNDAVINAEVAFDAAVRDAYRATLVFEYYTSQSYDRRGDLFLIRLVARGQRNLEDYLANLDNAFVEFEEDFGLPSTRVMKISLRDDIFNIPRLSDSGVALRQSERIVLLQRKLADPGLLDRNGYLTIPFQTRLAALSPATRNHKIRYIEAEMNVGTPGDSVARLYLVQGGTSVVRSVGDDDLFFRFPPVTAVMNPYFSGAKGVYAPEVYINQRLRDRPLVATDWSLVINQRDELVNQDIDLGTLNDIRLFIYYTDFTEF